MSTFDKNDEYCQKCACYTCLNDPATCEEPDFGTILPCRDCEEEGFMVICDCYES